MVVQGAKYALSLFFLLSAVPVSLGGLAPVSWTPEKDP
jgi:hypothetical protein